MAIGDTTILEVDEGSDNWNVIRWVRQDGTVVQRADITNWDLVVWSLETHETVYSLKDQANTDVPATFLWFDVLQKNDGFWGEDSLGYSMRHFGRVQDIGDGILKGGARYQWEYSLNTASYGRLFKKFIWDVQPNQTIVEA